MRLCCGCQFSENRRFNATNNTATDRYDNSITIHEIVLWLYPDQLQLKITFFNFLQKKTGGLQVGVFIACMHPNYH